MLLLLGLLPPPFQVLRPSHCDQRSTRLPQEQITVCLVDRSMLVVGCMRKRAHALSEGLNPAAGLGQGLVGCRSG